MTAIDTRAAMSSADQNDLPDSAFAYIEPGGTKDESGKTTPRSKRHFPVHDKAHAQNALARLSSSPFGDKARAKVLAACKKFGIEVSEGKSADRPAGWEQRRRSWAGRLLHQHARRSMQLARGSLEVRAKPDGTGGTNFQFLGYGATFSDSFGMWDPWGDPYDEEVEPGAFSETLALPGLDVPFLIGHNDAGIPMARTTNGTMHLSQDSRGLPVDALMSGRRSDVRDLADAVERGDIDEMSIGFVTLGQRWSPDWSKRYLTNLDLHRGDVSVVALAANPATRGLTMTAFPVSEAAAAGLVKEYRTPTQPYTAHKGETNECPVCHSVNADSVKHCDQCGHAMQPKSYVNNMAGVEDMAQQCSGCQQQNSADARYCCSCGHELAGDMGPGRWSQHRSQGEVQDFSTAPDFNLPAGTPAYNASAHGSNSLTCPHDDCPVYAGGDGDRALNAQDAKCCDQCGGPLYNADGLIVADDSGVVEEVGGAMADADLLSRRLRLLELA